MKLLEAPDDLLQYFVKTRYPHSFICVLNIADEDCVKWIFDHVGEWDVDIQTISIQAAFGYVLFEFDTEDDAIDFCNNVPDSKPYCVVFSEGITVHENT